MTTQPPNWVAERAKCSVDLVYLALRDVGCRDVKEINGLAEEKRHGFTFEFREGTPRFRSPDGG